ncbi:hypothetical protein AVEN_62964-1 [Araneus ventricosus]|uniref:Uncharacterized protein n=2 Tax=Araneus ventricosus TaxID=182803 RepID=A0A4Y2VT40_ARAVE|nr:hypothetical protein AVEN_62964-1 [Araneus ventricosus]
MTIEVEGVTKDISLCGLKVKSFGRNLPCIDLDTEPFYFPHENPLDGNKVAGLNFSALSNIGFRSDIEHDRLVAIALVRISPTCKKATTELEWRVTFGGGKRQGKATIKVDLAADTSDMSFTAKEPKALAFKAAYPGKAIAAGSPVVVDLEVSLEPGSLAPVIVEIKNLDANKKFPYDMCLGGVWFRGRNYPCFSPVQVESNFSSSGSNGNRNDSAVYNLGLVCNTFVDNRDEENKEPRPALASGSTMNDRPPRQHNQALRFLHYSPHYERLMQQDSVLPGYNRSSEMGPKSHTAIIITSCWQEPAHLCKIFTIDGVGVDAYARKTSPNRS